MKVTVTPVEVKKVAKPFPKLMIAKDVFEKDRVHVVLFTEPRVGIVVKSVNCSSCKTGFYQTLWIMSEFEDYDGVVTMQND
jgi:hypothetical protein